MSINFTEEQQKLLKKFGFEVLGTSVFHKKMGIEKEASELLRNESLSDLEEYIKDLLRAS